MRLQDTQIPRLYAGTLLAFSKLMQVQKIRNIRGQTALEYAMVLVMVIIPLAMAVRALLQDSKDPTAAQKPQGKNIMKVIIGDSYGDSKKLGVIGRPFP